jgi:hypothetical protein
VIVRALAPLTACLAAAGIAHGSVFVANDAERPQLAVDAKGYAKVTWLEARATQTVVVPPTGQLTHGGSIGADVSRPAAGVRLPMALTVWRAPGGMLYALQQWQVQPNGPMELHLSRWKGAPPVVVKLADDGRRLSGSVTNAGKPLSGFTKTLEGKRVRVYAFVDCFGCPAARRGWSRMLGVAPKADGTFAVLLRPQWTGKRYRATVAGPAYAPDARAEVAAP